MISLLMNLHAILSHGKGHQNIMSVIEISVCVVYTRYKYNSMEINLVDLYVIITYRGRQLKMNTK